MLVFSYTLDPRPSNSVLVLQQCEQVAQFRTDQRQGQAGRRQGRLQFFVVLLTSLLFIPQSPSEYLGKEKNIIVKTVNF